MTQRGSRLQKSTLTFGPVGRVAATVAVLSPLAFFFSTGVAGIIGFALWLIWVLPRAMRDIWRPAELAESDFTKIQRELRTEADLQRHRAGPGVASITERPGPARW